MHWEPVINIALTFAKIKQGVEEMFFSFAKYKFLFVLSFKVFNGPHLQTMPGIQTRFHQLILTKRANLGTG